MTTKDYVDYIWHYKVEDNMDWDFCSRILKQDGIAEISAEELEKDFKKYFSENMGIEPYSSCPKCGNKLLPRKSRYGYFIGCSKYPECTFMATNKKPYKTTQEDNGNE